MTNGVCGYAQVVSDFFVCESATDASDDFDLARGEFSRCHVPTLRRGPEVRQADFPKRCPISISNRHAVPLWNRVTKPRRSRIRYEVF